MATVSIIGAGNVGVTLGLLLARQGHTILDICNRSLASAEKAAVVIGAGQAVAHYMDMQPVDILLIATSDNALQTIAKDILTSPALRQGTIAFHCSGATPSDLLAPLREKGVAIAGVHPVKTFISPVGDADNFPGTWCGVEGDEVALQVLRPLFESFGAKCFGVKSDSKALYHAGIVFACNYLFPVIEAGLRCYEAAGVPREISTQMLAPVVQATVDNALRLGPGKAITGPIARGDETVVANQLKALGALDPDLKSLYAVLGSFAVELSAQKGVTTPEKLAQIRQMLQAA